MLSPAEQVEQNLFALPYFQRCFDERSPDILVLHSRCLSTRLAEWFSGQARLFPAEALIRTLASRSVQTQIARGGIADARRALRLEKGPL